MGVSFSRGPPPKEKAKDKTVFRLGVPLKQTKIRDLLAHVAKSVAGLVPEL